MIEIRLMGGLGNQMFQYAVLRSLSLDFKEDGVIETSGITNKTHNVYSLNHMNISKDIIIKEKSNKLRHKLNYLIYGYYFVFLQKSKNSFKRLMRIQKISQKFGMYCIPDGFGTLKKSSSKYKSLIGYFPSRKYFVNNEDIIKKELKVKTKILKYNEKILEEIKNSNSVCVHVRRGDYVGTSFQICTKTYYLGAMKIIKDKIKNPHFFIFSDDIQWCKENLDLEKYNIAFITNNNPSYEDLRLMYNCKHFIISNSTFSWWAQFLSENKNKTVLAPNIWYKNSNIKCDFYEKEWIKVNIETGQIEEK